MLTAALGKAAVSEEARRTYVESRSDMRTVLGERRVPARRGGRVEVPAVFSIL
jgi:hypothetical protein